MKLSTLLKKILLKTKSLRNSQFFKMLEMQSQATCISPNPDLRLWHIVLSVSPRRIAPPRKKSWLQAWIISANLLRNRAMLQKFMVFDCWISNHSVCFCVSGSVWLVIVVLIDGSEKRNCQLAINFRFLLLLKSENPPHVIHDKRLWQHRR